MNSGPLSKRTNPKHTTLEHEPVKDGDDPVGVDPTVDQDRGAFPGELVDDVQQLQLPATGGGVELEIEGPHDVRPDRAERADLRPDTHQPFLPAPLWYSQPLLAPQAPYPFVVDDPPRPPCALRSTTPPPPRTLLRKRDQEFAQAQLLPVDHRWQEPLGGAVLADNPARPALGHPEPITQHQDGGATTVRGQTFPSANSLSMSISKA